MSISTQTEIDFNKLPPFQKRQFVPENGDLTDLATVQDLYQKLQDRTIASVGQFEQWLLDRSELEAALDQTGSILYIKMTCQTDEPKRAQAYKDFIETIVPVIKPLDDGLNKKYIQTSQFYPMDDARYQLYTRKIQTNIELFEEKNIPLQTRVDILAQEYQTVCGAMTVQFEGKERTLPEMNKFLLEPDRILREAAWRQTAQRRLKDKDKLEDIFNQMLALRHEIAVNAKFKNFRDYKFKALHRFDYTPEDCKQYHRTIERLVVPLWKKILIKRKKQMKLDNLRPWDTSVDPLGRPALKPFEKVEELIQGCQTIFNKIDKKLGQQFADMAGDGLLDLASRKGKAPGGYQSTLNEARRPFIFMNAVGLDHDVRTLLHEGGHAFHALAAAHDPLVDYRHGPMEFNEVASMSMELLGGEYMATFYPKREDEIRSRQEHLEDIIYILIWVAIVDSFQHWIYENPRHASSERVKAWLEICHRFGGNFINWRGLTQEQSYQWHRQLHIFEVPFYYIEYGIAQLGALRVWLNAKKDWAKGLANYQRGLSLGGSKLLPEIFRAAGIEFDFSAGKIEPLMMMVGQELDKLDD